MCVPQESFINCDKNNLTPAFIVVFTFTFLGKKSSSFKLFLNFVLFMSVTRPLNSPGPKEP